MGDTLRGGSDKASDTSKGIAESVSGTMQSAKDTLTGKK